MDVEGFPDKLQTAVKAAAPAALPPRRPREGPPCASPPDRVACGAWYQVASLLSHRGLDCLEPDLEGLPA